MTLMLCFGLFVAVECSAIFVMYRNGRVYKARMAWLKSESDLLQRRIEDGKAYDGHRRFNMLPAYSNMVWKFWKPVDSFCLPLDMFYSDGGKA